MFNAWMHGTHSDGESAPVLCALCSGSRHFWCSGLSVDRMQASTEWVQQGYGAPIPQNIFYVCYRGI